LIDDPRLVLFPSFHPRTESLPAVVLKHPWEFYNMWYTIYEGHEVIKPKWEWHDSWAWDHPEEKGMQYNYKCIRCKARNLTIYYKCNMVNQEKTGDLIMWPQISWGLNYLKDNIKPKKYTTSFVTFFNTSPFFFFITSRSIFYHV
jgi:hypothetical protein